MAAIKNPVERYIARLKKRLYPIDIKEKKEIGLKLERIGKDSCPIMIKLKARLLTDNLGRTFIEYGSRDGLLELINLEDFEYREDSNQEKLIPLSCLEKDAVYETDAGGNIKKIYLSIYDSLCAPFRGTTEEIINQIYKNISNMSVWERTNNNESSNPCSSSS